MFPPIVGLNPIAEAGFPDVVCPVIFLPACNLRCEYCMNSSVVLNKITEHVDAEYVIKYMKDNDEKELLISGGEPTIHDSLPELISFLKSSGFNIRLSTNGTNYPMLKKLIDDRLISFAALDIKSSLKNISKSTIIYSHEQFGNLMSCVLMLNDIVENPIDNFSFEFRTTLYPPYVEKQCIIEISEVIHKDSIWFLQQFRNSDGLLASHVTKNVKPYNDSDLNDILTAARKNVTKTFLRWP